MKFYGNENVICVNNDIIVWCLKIFKNLLIARQIYVFKTYRVNI